MAATGIRYVFSLFSANALQIFFSQLGSLILFWLSSKELQKEEFGLFNWFFAIYGTLSTILTFGFDYIVIRRVSAKNEIEAARIQFLQNLVICIVSVLPLAFILLRGLGAGGFVQTLGILVAFQFSFLSLPFKNALTGRELFMRSASSVIVSNLAKVLIVIFLHLTGRINLQTISLSLAICNLMELIFYAVNSRILFDGRFLPLSGFRNYKELFRESLPQLGVIIFDSAFARIDWILLGLLSGTAAAVNTAEYSFAYKIFELSKLPLLVLAPVLFTRFSRLFFDSTRLTTDVRSGIHSFFKMEISLGLTVPIILNIAWVPLMQFFTDGKYGPGNALIYLLLSFTLPAMYMINFLWTMAFAQGQLKLTMVLSIVNSLLNIALNVILIPSYGQMGAAIAFLTCNVVMLPVYLYFVKQSEVRLPLSPALAIIIIALISCFLAHLISINLWVKTALALLFYTILLLVFRLFTANDLRRLKLFITQD